jgi:hypothetical protein
VAHERQQIASDFCETIYSPRYVARYWYMDSGAAGELLDPLGYRRNDSSTASYPQFVRAGAEGGKGRSSAGKVPRFAYFIPMVIGGGDGQPRQLYEGGRHAHGAQSGVEHWFTEDWILVRDRTVKSGEETAFDWSGGGGGPNGFEHLVAGRDAAIAARKAPGVTIVFDAEGKPNQATTGGKGRGAPPGVKEVAAVFIRPDGYQYGQLQLYPPGSRFQGGQVYQPGERPMGFTFATEGELPALLRKWRENPPSGEVSTADAARYRGAFMAQPVAPE